VSLRRWELASREGDCGFRPHRVYHQAATVLGRDSGSGGCCRWSEKSTAALRGSVGYATAAVVANAIKPFVKRPRPPQAGKGKIGPLTSSFPSGHTATDLAFVFSAAQELPALFVPLAAGTVSGHWSIVRARSHYISDVLVGGVVGIAVALAMRKVWLPTPNAGQQLVDRR
jgi:membrane-associated phospholipid phosphatase